MGICWFGHSASMNLLTPNLWVFLLFLFFHKKAFKVYPEEKVLVSPEKEYFFWHIERDKLYFHMSRPLDTKPVMEEGWWAEYEAFTRD
jgi:hypothetical protein